MVPRVVSWGWETPVTTAREGPTCSVTGGLKSCSIASCPYNRLTGTGAPVPAEAQPQGADRRHLSCYRATGILGSSPVTAQWSRGPPAAGREASAKGKRHGSASRWAGVHGPQAPLWPPGPVLSHPARPAASAPPPRPRGPNPALFCAPPALWLVPSCQQSALRLLLAEGLSLCLIFPVGERPGEQPPPDSQPRGLDQSWGHLWPSSPEPLRKHMGGGTAPTLWSWSDLSQG